ncbi:MAG: extracellular solute-binding protein [Oscillospiraceae bacterium]|nr:extracellular solute-binding protein [Oscillospiraceae bacterium]
MKMKRITAIVLALVMVFALASCGSGTQTRGDENQNEFLIVGGMSALSSGNDSNPVLVELAEKAGVEIEWDLMSDSLGEKVGVLIGGNQLPDAFIACNFNQNDLNEYGSDGTFIDITKYITPEIMPNLSAILEKHPEIKSGITQADGCIYGLPSGELMGTAAIGADDDLSIYAIPEFSMINKTWLDELGLAVPTNLTELHDVLVAFRDAEKGGAGSTIPMSTGYDQWCWGQEIFYAGFGFTNFTSDICFDLIANPDGTVKFVSATEEYRDAVTYFHDWYAEGLMDLEMFSQSTSQLISKVSGGKVGVTTWWEIKEIAGDHTDDFVFLPPMYGPQGTKYATTRNVNIRSGPGVTSGNLNVTSACGNPELLLKYFDQWYDPEVTMQLQYGPIGIYFTEKDANGVWQSITDEAAKAQFGKSSGELKGQYEVLGPRLILAEYYNKIFYMEDRATERLHQIEEYWMPYVQSPAVYPNDVTFTNDELEVISRYKADFVSQVAEYEGTWLKNGGPTDDEWNAYLKMLEDNCGMSRLLDVYQSAYTRYMSNK